LQGGSGISAAPGWLAIVELAPREFQPAPRDAVGPPAEDDSAFFRNMLAPVLKAAGYRVATANSGTEGLNVLRSGRQFNVILTDIEMPDMNGFEFAEAIRADQRTAGMPIIALSSVVSPAAIERGRQVGFHDYVAKFDRPGLIAALKEQTSHISRAA